MAVRIYLEIGHEASLRTKKTQEGFTHDWEVFVRGCDGAEIHYYIEKVVFYLHETFTKPKRVVKEPPYSVKESGYAGFNLPIDIYLRNNNEPKKIRFNYDLHLQQSGPPIIKVQKEKYVFNLPTDDFKMKLLKGGGTIGSSSTQEMSDTRSSLDDKNQMTNKPKLSGSDFVKRQRNKFGDPGRDFQELFGSPITMSKSSEQKMQVPKPPDNKGVEKSRTKHSPHKESHKDKEKSKEKTDSEKKSRDEKKQKDKSKDRERSKDKSVKKEKSPRPRSPSPKRSPKRSASPSRFSSPPVIKHKENKHDKEKRDKVEERKPKKEKRSKEHKENKHGDEQKAPSEEHREKVRIEKKESSKMKIETAASPPPPPPKVIEKKEKSNKEKSSKDTPKDDKYSEKYKHKKKDKEKREKKEEKSYKSEKKSEKTPEPKPNLFKSEPPPPPKKEKSFVIPNVDDESSNSSTTSSSSSLERQPEKKPKNETIKIKEEKNLKLKKEKGYQENAIKCKRKSNSVEVEEPPEKVHRDHGINNNSDGEQESKTALTAAPEGVEEDYFGLLRDLQHKIMGLKDNSDLQKVVKLIAETGRYEVSAHTFDFDLCLLDRSTVQQLQDFFASET